MVVRYWNIASVPLTIKCEEQVGASFRTLHHARIHPIHLRQLRMGFFDVVLSGSSQW